jgi:hypothetical protein
MYTDVVDDSPFILSVGTMTPFERPDIIPLLEYNIGGKCVPVCNEKVDPVV